MVQHSPILLLVLVLNERDQSFANGEDSLPLALSAVDFLSVRTDEYLPAPMAQSSRFHEECFLFAYLFRRTNNERKEKITLNSIALREEKLQLTRLKLKENVERLIP